MALSTAHGSVRILTDIVGTTYPITGLGFQPKAIMFWWTGQTLAVGTDGANSTINLHRGIGFAVDASNRRCAISFNANGAGSSNCGSSAHDNAVIAQVDGTGTVIGLIDISSIDADGFTLIVDDQVSPAMTVFWRAWGGADITVAAVGNIAEPAATGDQDYTVTGFVSGATNQVVLIAGGQTTAALNTGSATDNGLCFGFATGAGAENVVLTGNSDDAAATMDTDGYARGDECLAMIAVAGGNPDARASLTQFGTDNFRLNWAARALTDRRYVFLAMKGGSWKAGDYTINPTTVSNTATVSGLSFAPKGIVSISRSTSEQGTGVSDINDIFMVGTGDSTSSRRCQSSWDEDGTAVSEINMVLENDQVLAGPSNAGGVLTAFDINAMNSDGFQIIVDIADAGASASTWQGYLAFGDAPAGGSAIVPISHYYDMLRAS